MPDHEPEARQDVALVDSHDKLTEDPIKTSVEDELIEAVGLTILSIVFGLSPPPPPQALSINKGIIINNFFNTLQPLVNLYFLDAVKSKKVYISNI